MEALRAIPLVLMDGAAWAALGLCALGVAWMAYDLLGGDDDS